MQEKLNEANAAIIREKEAAKIAIEQAPPVIKEVPVVDNTKLDLLTNHNKELEVKKNQSLVILFVWEILWTTDEKNFSLLLLKQTLHVENEMKKNVYITYDLLDMHLSIL